MTVNTPIIIKNVYHNFVKAYWKLMKTLYLSKAKLQIKTKATP